jgi:hypothetical protein
MEKLNNGEALPLETRLEMYLELLKIYRTVYVMTKHRNIGFCFTVTRILKRHFYTLHDVWIDQHAYLLPELWDLRTVKYAEYWYNNVVERLEALEKAIEIVSSLLNGPGNTNT